MIKVNNNINISPFVKWVGGKRDVIKKYLANHFPEDFNNYFEPFVGGGAVLLHLQPNNVVINDINKELIATYKAIKRNPIELMNILNEYHNNHSKDFYYELRKQNPNNNVEKAARLIYLNKTCFNGLYRVNSKNEFNVPFNNKTKDKLVLYNKDNILALSKYLKQSKTKIYSKDFKEIFKQAKTGDFIFCDPPYDYEEENKNGFDSYDKNNFGKKGQIELANCLKEADKQGIKWMLTNHNTKLINELYKDFKIIPIKTNRNVNSNGTKRKNTGDEVIVINYEK